MIVPSRHGHLVVRGLPEWSATSAPTVDEEAIERVRLGVDRVQIRDEPVRGLRLADRDHGLDRSATGQHVRVATPNEHPDLGEDVVREAVSRMVQCVVADRVRGLEATGRHAADRRRVPLDPGRLRGHPDPRDALSDHDVVRGEPVRRSVEAGRDVAPFDDGDA